MIFIFLNEYLLNNIHHMIPLFCDRELSPCSFIINRLMFALNTGSISGTLFSFLVAVISISFNDRESSAMHFSPLDLKKIDCCYLKNICHITIYIVIIYPILFSIVSLFPFTENNDVINWFVFYGWVFRCLFSIWLQKTMTGDIYPLIICVSSLLIYQGQVMWYSYFIFVPDSCQMYIAFNVLFL